MKMIKKYLLVIACFLLITSCQKEQELVHKDQKKSNRFGKPSDPQISAKAEALFYNLKATAKSGNILFGQQDPTCYGVKWDSDSLKAVQRNVTWITEEKSDFNDVSQENPAIYGWNVGYGYDKQHNIDSVSFDKIKELVISSYKRGGIQTFTWHDDPAIEAIFDHKQIPAEVVTRFLPGGSHHEKYLEEIDRIIAYFNSLEVDGEKIPFIFRPYHEWSGFWNWYSTDRTSPKAFKQLWRMTIDRMRSKGVHHMLLAYASDKLETEDELLTFYPGDAYVDIIGMDIYIFEKRKDLRYLTPIFGDRLKVTVETAEKIGKIPALLETGFDNVEESPDWWQNILLHHIRKYPESQRLAYALVWRNGRPDHYYVPYPGHHGIQNFIDFINDPKILLEKDIPNMYEWSGEK